jgi:uncharacterized protein YndB with AHSA1/START domain
MAPTESATKERDVFSKRSRTRFVWTSAMLPGFIPQARPEEGFFFTAILEFESVSGGTLYRATVRHETVADAQAHAEMGFEAGWGAALDQLVALFAKSLRCGAEDFDFEVIK